MSLSIVLLPEAVKMESILLLWYIYHLNIYNYIQNRLKNLLKNLLTLNRTTNASIHYLCHPSPFKNHE